MDDEGKVGSVDSGDKGIELERKVELRNCGRTSSWLIAGGNKELA